MINRTVTVLLFLALFCLSLPVNAMQGSPSTGIIDPSRATDWSGVGAVISTSRTQCGTTIAAYTGTAAAINNAIASCGADHYVQLGAGTFNLSTGILLSKNNVTLRGAGASSTILNITGIAGVGCHIGDARAFNVCANGGNIGVDSAENTATWSSGYSKGSTTIVLSSHTNMTVGHTIWLDQLDDSTAYPAAGDVWVSNWGAGDAYVRTDRGLVEGHIVTSCGASTPGAACTSNTITISPGIHMPSVRSSQSPGAWWGNSTSILVGAGVENLTIDSSGATANAVYMINCTGCWMKGVRTLYRNMVGSGEFRINNFINVMNSSVVDSYFYGPQASNLVSIYGIAIHVASGFLFQNNIIHGSVNPLVINSSTYGSVFAYNVFDNTGVSSSYSQSSFILHGHASMNLFESNNGKNFSGDNIHTSHFFTTLFRNNWDGTLRNPSSTETQAGVALYAAQRFFNVIGNVLGGSGWSSYANGQAPPNHCASCIFELGWQGTNSNGIAATGNDTNTGRTLMRWGNWDNVSNASRFQASEVPSGITNYSNPVPASQALPASFYLSGQPSWWTTAFGTPPWPAIGPDVSGGSLPNSGGHAYKIPSRVCLENLAVDPAYPSSSPRVLLFSESTCYPSTGGPPDTTGPSTPTSLTATPVSSSQINLAWLASTDNVGVAGYKIFRSGTQVGTSVTTSFQDIGLSSSTTYSYTVTAYDSSGNDSAQSGSASAPTLTPAAAPALSSINASNIAATAATISWTTSIAADSQIEYGPTISYGSQTALITNLVSSHVQTLSGLMSNTTYNYRVKSREITGSLATSANFTFTTGALPPGNPLVNLRFDESGGTVAADSSGNGLNGTLVNSPSFVAGRVGNAIQLDGAQYVDLGNPAALQLTGSMTISGWIKSSSFPVDDAAIVSNRTSGSLGLQLDTTVDTGPRTIGFKLTNSSGNKMYRYGSTTLAANNWYYVSGVYDAATQAISVYLNGNLDNGTLIGPVTATQQNSTLNVFVGRRAGVAGFEFSGSIDEVRIYGRALTQAEIQAEMNASASPTDTIPPIVSINLQ